MFAKTMCGPQQLVPVFPFDNGSSSGNGGHVLVEHCNSSEKENGNQEYTVDTDSPTAPRISDTVPSLFRFSASRMKSRNATEFAAKSSECRTVDRSSFWCMRSSRRHFFDMKRSISVSGEVS